MARSIVKSKRAADKEEHSIAHQREEFRLLAGEWATGHPVVPAVPLRGDEYEKWQQKLDEYVDLFIDAIRLGNVEKEFIDRIPPEMKREIGEAIQKSIPGAAPDMKKKKRDEQNQRKIERAKEKAAAKAKEEKISASPASLANAGAGSEEEPGQIPGYADPDMGPTIPAEVLAQRQTEAAEEKKTKFERFKESMGKTKRGFANLGKMAAVGIKGAMVAQSPFLRNTLLAYEGIKTAFSKNNTDPSQPVSGARLIGGAFNRLASTADPDDTVSRREDRIAEARRQAKEEKLGITNNTSNVTNNSKSFTTNVVKNAMSAQTSNSTSSTSSPTTQNTSNTSTQINNQTSLSKAAAAEAGSESDDGSVLGLLKKIEENTRKGDESDEKKKKKSPLSELFENAKKMLNGVINGVKTLLNSLKTVITGMIGAIKTAVGSLGKLFGRGASGAAKGVSAGGKAGAKGVTRALPPRDPVTGRFMKATDAAKGAVGKSASGAAKAATTAAGKSATGTVAKALGSKAVPLIGTALAVGEGVYDAYQTHQAFEAGEITEKERNAGYGEAAGGTSGALAGAAAGAAIGSVVPVVGTAIGGIVGGAAGYFGGGKAGKWLGGMFGSDKTKKEIEAAKVSAVPQVVPKLDGAAQIIASPPPDKATPVEQAVAATNDSVTKLASSLAMVNSKSNTVAQGGNSTSVMIRNSARDHDSTFRRYLFDRSVYA